MNIGAIDPGVKGAVAILFDKGGLFTAQMPVMGSGRKRIVNGAQLASWFIENHVDKVILEEVWTHPQEGVSSGFKFGTVYGQALGVIQALFIPYHPVTPAKWKRSMGLSSDKELSRRRAIETFPKFSDQFARKMDEGRAEAALLALYGQRLAIQPPPHDGIALEQLMEA